MRLCFSVSAIFLSAAVFGGCAIMPTPEATPLGCGQTKDTVHHISTINKPVPVAVSFTMACEADKKFVEIAMKDHPWGIGKTMPRSVGANDPKPYSAHYEKISCEMTSELKFKWDDMENYEHFANTGRPISNINDVQIDMRFREDYLLRHYMLNSAKNLCSAAPQ